MSHSRGDGGTPGGDDRVHGEDDPESDDGKCRDGLAVTDDDVCRDAIGVYSTVTVIWNGGRRERMGGGTVT